MSTLKENVFRAYDVRGLYPTEVDANLAENIGKAFGTFIHNTESAKKRLIKFGEEPVIAVGGDVRLHTPKLKAALIRGLQSTGVKVVDFGILPTPLLYFAVAFKRLDGGVAVTASVDSEERTLIQNNKTKQISMVKVGEFIDRNLDDKGYNDYSVLAFDPELGGVKFKQIRGVYKHKISEPLYEIILVGGRRVKVTASHSVFTERGGKIISIPTKELKVGDLVPVPYHIPIPNTIPKIDILNELWPHRHDLRKILVSGNDIIKINKKRNFQKNVKKLKLSSTGKKLLWEKRLAMGLSRRRMGELNKISPMTIQRMELGTERKFVKKTFVQRYASQIGFEPEEFLSNYTEEERVFDQNWQGGKTMQRMGFDEITESEIKEISYANIHGFHNPDRQISNTLEITPDLARIIGYYVAEGSLECKDRVAFTLGLPERGHESFIIQDLTELFKSVFGLTPVVYKRKHNSVKLSVDNIIVYGLFSKIFGFEGRQSHTKHVPDFIFSLPTEHKIEFLKGVFLGDGSLSKGKWIRFYSTSEDLIIGITYLLAQLGINFSFARRKDKRVDRKGSFEVIITEKSALDKVRGIWEHHWNADSINTSYRGHKKNKSRKGNLLLLPIKEIREISPTSSYVYDFSVQGETFIAGSGGICCHNSHNPKEYNGFKFCTYGGTCLSWETGIKSLMEAVREGKFKIVEKEGKCSEYNIEEEYKHYISTKINLRWMDNLKIVVDAGNGVCGKVASDLFQLAGCKVVKLYCDPDGNFPNHGPDPIKKQNLADLQKSVVENKAYLGVAYDGDGDRVGFVDKDGNIMESQIVLSVFAKDVLKNQAGSKIVFDVRISKAVEDVVMSCGGIPVESRVGHSYIQSAVNNGCAFGGEHTGHYFFRENFGFDDGVFASLKFAEILAKNGGLEKLTVDIPKYFTSDEVRVLCKDEEKFGVIDKIKNMLKSEYEVSEIDGAKVILDNGWFLIRASNTEPALTLRWEAKTQDEFDKIKSVIKNILQVNGLETNW